MTTTDEEELPSLEMLPSEVVCPECWLTYHRHLGRCPNCEVYR